MANPLRAIIYHRCSTDAQELDAQRSRTKAICEYRGWQIVQTEEDHGFSGKNLERPGLRGALALLETGFANVLVVSKLDRLSRSVYELLSIVRLAKAQKWDLFIGDPEIDTGSPHGRMFLTIMAALAEWEREMISQRTKETLAEKKAQGIIGGRKRIPQNTVRRIFQLREQGHTLGGIADVLNADKVPTRDGKPWHPATLSGILKRYAPEAEASFGVKVRRIPRSRALHQTEIPKSAVDGI